MTAQRCWWPGPADDIAPCTSQEQAPGARGGCDACLPLTDDNPELTLIGHMYELLTRDGLGAMQSQYLRKTWSSSEATVRASVLARLAWQTRHSPEVVLAAPNQGEQLASGLRRSAQRYETLQDIIVPPASRIVPAEYRDADWVIQMWASLVLMAAVKRDPRLSHPHAPRGALRQLASQ